jgi:hypothetical protein
MDESQKIEDKKPRVFISYSRKNIEFVDRLQATLKGRGIEAFVDRKDIEKSGGRGSSSSSPRPTRSCSC